MNKCIEDLKKEKLLEIVLLSRLHACSTPYLVESAEKKRFPDFEKTRMGSLLLSQLNSFLLFFVPYFKPSPVPAVAFFPQLTEL